MPVGGRVVVEAALSSLRAIRDAVSPPPPYMRSAYRGHFAVTRSLVEGLRKSGIPATYNPRALGQVAEIVVVLSGLRALGQAVMLKRRGTIKTLLAGPNLVTFPSEARQLLCAPEVDVCLTPGPLTCRIYVDDCPELDGRCVAWPAGVDTEYWSPGADRGRSSVLFFDKQAGGPTDPLEPYMDVVRGAGFPIDRVSYGQYTREEYREKLRRARIMVGFSTAESQGIAWAEAWSVNVPTLIWRRDRHAFRHPRAGLQTYDTSTAPALTPATGEFFRDLDEFRAAFDRWKTAAPSAPRQWVMENMSDEVCARRLCAIAGLQV